MIFEKPIQHWHEINKFCYFDEGKYKGTFSLIGDEIWDVCVFKRFRGNSLCVKMLSEFLQENPGNYTLYVAKDNLPARKSYEKLGFEYIQNLEIDFIEMFEMKINKEN
jgi:ribosomal protein S18 acetylase RimI-like enzyme